MHRNVLPIFVGALAIALAILSYLTYQQQRQLSELTVKVGDGTVSVVKP
jgi:hypothetical protein